MHEVVTPRRCRAVRRLRAPMRAIGSNLRRAAQALQLHGHLPEGHLYARRPARAERQSPSRSVGDRVDVRLPQRERGSAPLARNGARWRLHLPCACAATRLLVSACVFAGVVVVASCVFAALQQLNVTLIAALLVGDVLIGQRRRCRRCRRHANASPAFSDLADLRRGHVRRRLVGRPPLSAGAARRRGAAGACGSLRLGRRAGRRHEAAPAYLQVRKSAAWTRAVDAMQVHALALLLALAAIALQRYASSKTHFRALL